ncbi:MAG: Ig-like domain-containing protein [Candidatus Methanoperedens sp.]|nr:Ig-like domain-containing protein [Candidatus Methanoperedens sp.]
MKSIERNKSVIIVVAILAVCAIFVLAYFAPLQKSKNVIIVTQTSVSEGASENNTETESIKLHGTFWNEGNLVAKNLTGIVIFTDAAHNKVVSKNIPISGDLLPDKGLLMTFDSEYTRERTVPKTDVNITIQSNWMEDGQSKNYSLLVYSGSYSVTIVTTQLNQTSIMLGESVNDTASLTAFGGYNATGTVTFQVKTPAADWATYDIENLTLTSGMATSAAYSPEAGTGTYYFRANYSGDTNYIGNQSDAEKLIVTKSAE